MQSAQSAIRTLAMGLIAGCLLHCSNATTEPGKPEYPTRLHPYEDVYDSVTFRLRRDALAASLPPGSLAIVATNETHLRNGDVEYEFRPASTFYYLTGFDEPHAAAFIRRKGETGSELILFVEERDSAKTRLLGPTWGPIGAVQRYGADSAYAYSSLPTALQANGAGDSSRLFYSNLADNAAFRALFLAAGGDSAQVIDLASELNAMRFVKDAHELDLTQKSVDIAVQAFTEGIRSVEAGQYEFELESVFDLVRRVNGSVRNAFPTIVASGSNTAIFHYTANNRKMLAGDLVLIDFGVEYGYYASDLARTFPVSGSFSPAQALVYDIVQNTLDTLISRVKPGVDYWELAQACPALLIDGLLQQGIISGDKETLIRSERYLDYAPTGLGHPIGLDVHDPVPVDTVIWKSLLREGVTLAFEPGIYLGVEDATVAEAYRGICVRIEDNIRVTASGHEVMSAKLPRSRKDIEALMRSR
jgi:Xaa-Pro aminopeptidase